jgi:hypothetical protein
MADIKETKDELVEVTLSRPFTTNGEVFGYENQTRDGKKVRVFTGKAKVPAGIAEDLNRREAEYKEYLAGLNRDKGGENQVSL